MVGRLRSADASAVATTVSEVRRSFVDIERLVGRIVQHLRAFPPDLVDAGRALLDAVGDYEWSPSRREFELAVTEPGRAVQRVTITWNDERDFRDACSCREGTRGCRHAYAACYHLYSVLSMSDEDVRLELAAPADSSTGSSASASSPTWSDRLADLDRLLESHGRRTGRSRGGFERAGARARVAWRVAVSGRGAETEVEVSPLEERRTATGRWSRPRPMTWARYLASPELRGVGAENLIAAIVATSGERGSGAPADAFDVLAELVGHPRVHLEGDDRRPVEVLDARLSVALRVGADGALDLVPSLGGRAIERTDRWRVCRRGLVVADLEEGRVLVARERDDRLALAAHVLRDDVSVPRDAREALLARLPALEAIVPIELPRGVREERRDSDARTHVLLSPTERGIRVALRSFPLGDALGDGWRPGAGPSRHVRSEGELWIIVERDFDRELAAARRHAEELGLPGDGAETAWTWDLDSMDESLELLVRLRREPSDDRVVHWPEGGEIRVAPAEAGGGDLRIRIRERDGLFDVAGLVRFDDAEVLLALVFDRLDRGSRWVPIDAGRWAEVSTRLAERLAALARTGRRHGGEIEVDRTMLPSVEEALEGLPEIDRCESWAALSRRFARAVERAPERPRGLRATLREYQLDGWRWMLRLGSLGIGACLADDMGLGKTVQTLAALVERAPLGPALVIAPTSVAFNWAREAERFAPGLNVVLYRDTSRRGAPRRFRRGDLVVASYGLLRRDVERLGSQRWGTVVLDEAQQIKNPRSRTAQAACTIDARWRLALTGTPIENGLGELWSLFRFLSPGLLGSRESFKREFIEPIERRQDEGVRRRLGDLTRPFILRRAKSEVLHELPPRTDVRLTIALSTAERRLYENARRAALAQLAGRRIAGDDGGERLRFDVLAALTRLRQLACHPRLVDPDSTVSSAKMGLCLAKLDELRQGGHHALVFSQFTRHLELIRDELAARDVPVAWLEGKTSARDRAREVDRFQSGEADVFLISLKAGGTGLNLTAADYVFHMDPWWNPAAEDQATDRAHRIGQQRPVTVYRLVSEDTIEERIAGMQDGKRDLLGAVLEGTNRAAGLSAEELVDLIRVSSAARCANSDDPGA